MMSLEACNDPLMLGAGGMEIDDNAMANLEMMTYDPPQPNTENGETGFDFDELHFAPEAVLSQPFDHDDLHPPQPAQQEQEQPPEQQPDQYDAAGQLDMAEAVATAAASIIEAQLASPHLAQHNNNLANAMGSPYQAPGVTKVDGLGLWRSFTRNFKTPVFACLDLLDNSLDATLSGTNNPQRNNDEEEEPPFQGKVTIERMPPNGLVITNNSYRPIKPLDQVLGVYQSSKGNNEEDGTTKADAIGENGVGLKQGCATLSDTSFVLTRNHNVFGFGVIAYQLQTNEGCCLPSFSFEIENDDDLTPEQIEQLVDDHITAIVTDNPKIRQIVADDMGNGHVQSGVARLVRHLLVLWNDEWEPFDYCFRLIIAKLKHTQSTTDHRALSTRSTTADDPALAFMDELRQVLPRQYINIPLKDFAFTIGGQRVLFSYWQRRLVELTKFKVYINLEKKVGDLAINDWHREGYPLSIYCGFDPLRVEDADAEKTMGLYIYSRSSGRLIRHWPDGRGLLGLPNTGSDYGQGLTVLVDDVHGMLPLNPTKQDIAWSEQAQAQAHEQNFYDWVGAVASLYWNHHADRFGLIGGGKKTKLTDAVTEFADPVRRYIHDQENMERRNAAAAETAVALHTRNARRASANAPPQLHSMEHADLTTFDPIYWTRRCYRGKKISIRCEKQKLQPTPGKETLFQWTDEQYRQYDKDTDVASTKKRKATGTASLDRAVAMQRVMQQLATTAVTQNSGHDVLMPVLQGHMPLLQGLANGGAPPWQGQQQLRMEQLQVQQRHNLAMIQQQQMRAQQQEKLLLAQQAKIREHERRQQEFERKQKLLQQQEQFGNDSLFAEMFPNDAVNVDADNDTNFVDNNDDVRPAAVQSNHEAGVTYTGQRIDSYEGNDDSDDSEIIFVGTGHDGQLEHAAPRKQTARKSTGGKAPRPQRPTAAVADPAGNDAALATVGNPARNDAALASVLNAEVERLKQALEEQTRLAASAQAELDSCRKDLDDTKDDLEGANQEKVLLEKQLEHAKKAALLKNEQEVENLKIEKDDLKFQLLEAQRTIRKQERELRTYRAQEEKAGGGANGLVNGYGGLSQESV